MDVLHWMKFVLPVTEHADLLSQYDEDYPLVASVHAPLGHAVTQVYARHLCSKSPNGKFKYFRKELCESLGMSADEIQAMLQRLVERGDYKVGKERLMTMVKPKQPARFQPDVVIASAGMCDNGPVVSYLEQWDSDPRNTVILTGYQSIGSKGAELMQRATETCVPDRAEVVDMSAFYSAHADQSMLLDFIFRIDGYDRGPAATVFLNHGNPDSKYALKTKIEERAVEQGAEDRRIAAVRLADARWVNLDTGEPIEESHSDPQLLSELEALRLLVKQLTH